jgi:hypothetical protein
VVLGPAVEHQHRATLDRTRLGHVEVDSAGGHAGAPDAGDLGWFDRDGAPHRAEPTGVPAVP